MSETDTKDAVAEFCDATRANDVDRIVSTLAPDAELLSPLFGRMVFRGRDDLRVLLGAVYGALSGLAERLGGAVSETIGIDVEAAAGGGNGAEPSRGATEGEREEERA